MCESLSETESVETLKKVLELSVESGLEKCVFSDQFFHLDFAKGQVVGLRPVSV